MRLFVIAASIPHAVDNRPDVSAVDIVEHELMRALMRRGHELAFQPIFNVHREKAEISEIEAANARRLRGDGVELLPPIHKSAYHNETRTNGSLTRLGLVALGRPAVELAYPAARLRARITGLVAAARADAVLTIWSPEGVAAATSRGHIPIVAYQGDVDYQPGLARDKDRRLFEGVRTGRGLVRRARDRAWLAEFERAHLRLMRDVNVIANVTASNATFYARLGHPRSVYVRNVWRQTRPPDFSALGRDGGPVRIVGHAGRLDATGSTYGLRYLLVDLLPALDAELADIDYRIEIIGAGEIVPALRPLLAHPRLLLRGFVPNLDHELRTASVYLLLNNAGPYLAAYTRHLVAWSVGACLVVHANSRLAIPEIEHGENALVGSTPREIAALVRLAVTDAEAIARVRRAGRATYERFFTPDAVGAALDVELRRAAGT